MCLRFLHANVPKMGILAANSAKRRIFEEETATTTTMVKGISLHNKTFPTLLLLLIAATSSYAQLTVVDNVGPVALVQSTLVGNEGIVTRNISYTGNPKSLAYFENGESTGLGIDKGIILSTGDAIGAKGPNNDGGYTSGTGGEGSALLEQFIPYKTMDAATLQFDFKPQTDHIVFNYVFSSDEYIEWVDSGFNDIFGFFISGPGIDGEKNVALVPDTTIEVTIDNINHKRNSEYFILNDDTSSNMYAYLQHDGQTVTLQAVLELEACNWYTIKMAIADVGDPDKDSWVFIQAKSFKHETNLVGDTSFCHDDFQLVLDAGNPDFNVKWTTGETTQKIVVDTFGTYGVEVFTGCGSFKDEVNIDPLILPLDLGNDTSFCGNAVNYNVDMSGYGYEEYTWSNNSKDSSYTVSDTGWYWLEVYSSGCTLRDSVYVEGREIPQFDLGQDTIYCGQIEHTLYPRRSADSYSWSTGSTDPFITVTEPGTYKATLTLDGCSYSDSIHVDSAAWPTVNLGEPTRSVCGMDSLLLSTGINDTAKYYISWSTGETTPSIKVFEPGIYSVSVSDNICNYTVSDQVELVRLQALGDYAVPNAFTPNGDDLNDVFRPLQTWTSLTEYRMVVFNRWGEQMFLSYDPEESWDGTAKDGSPALPDVYMFEIIVKTPCSENRIQSTKGMLHLIR